MYQHDFGCQFARLHIRMPKAGSKHRVLSHLLYKNICFTPCETRVLLGIFIGSKFDCLHLISKLKRRKFNGALFIEVAFEYLPLWRVRLTAGSCLPDCITILILFTTFTLLQTHSFLSITPLVTS